MTTEEQFRKKCPFCGSHVSAVVSRGRLGIWTSYVHCKACGTQGPHSMGHDADKEARNDAVERWNYRQPYDP